MIGRLSGEGGCDLGSGPAPCLYASLLCGAVVVVWRVPSLTVHALARAVMGHGREVSESGDIHTANSLGHRGHTHSLCLSSDCFPRF